MGKFKIINIVAADGKEYMVAGDQGPSGKYHLLVIRTPPPASRRVWPTKAKMTEAKAKALEELVRQATTALNAGVRLIAGGG